MIKSLAVLPILLLSLSPASAATPEPFDYFAPQRTMLSRGVQAVLTCNGLFTSGRTLEQVFEQELAYLDEPVGTAHGGAYRIHRERQVVEIGDPATGPVMRAAFREGIGCIILSPDQGLEHIDNLPRLDLAPPPGDPDALPWPDGDRLDGRPLPPDVDETALRQASDWAFERDSEEQVTLSLLVVHRGQIIHERYAPGVDRHTRTRTWSTAKSIAVTLIGMLVDEGRMQLDAPLDLEWLPPVSAADEDPRSAITLRHVLNMSSGLYPVDSFGMEYATGSGMAYWAGASSAKGARDRGLIREPGTFWDYENYDTLLAVLAMKQVLDEQREYLEYPRRALLDRIGMRSTLVSTDRFGDFILSSQVYASARDLARFGLLYLAAGRLER